MNLNNSRLDSTLSRVAGTDKTDDDLSELLGVSDLSASNSELREALKATMASERQRDLTNAANDIRDLLQYASTTLETKVSELRDLRLEEKRKKAKIDQIARARDYGVATMNFLPLLAALRGDTNPEHQVPAEWKHFPKSDVVA